MTRRRFRTSTLSLLCLSFLMGNRFMTMASEPEEPTPLLLSVADPPAPFVGSDQRVHLVYELRITNFSSGQATIESVEVLGDGAVLKKMDAAEIATRLQPAGCADRWECCQKARRHSCSCILLCPPEPGPPARFRIGSSLASRRRLPAIRS
jgi:hypothetical protein